MTLQYFNQNKAIKSELYQIFNMKKIILIINSTTLMLSLSFSYYKFLTILLFVYCKMVWYSFQRSYNHLRKNNVKIVVTRAVIAQLGER